MTTGQYYWLCVLVAAAIVVTVWLLVRHARARWRRGHPAETAWRRLADQDGPLVPPGRWGQQGRRGW